MIIKTGQKETPRVVFIHEGCKIKENSENIIITEPNGKEHTFPKGSYVFTDRCNLDPEKW